MVWFSLAFSAALFWALGHILLKRGFDHVPPLWNNILDKLISFILWTPVILFLSGFKIAIPPLPIAAVIIAAAALYHFFFYAISKGQISLTGTIVAGYPLFTILLSYFFLNEQLSLIQYAGVALILAGDVVVALPDKGAAFRSAKPIRGHDYTWVLWGFIGALALGVGDFLTKLSINRIGSHSHIFWLALIGNFVAGCNYLIDRRNRPLPPLLRREGLPALLGIVTNLIGALFFLLAFDFGKVSLIAPVSSIYPAFMALLAIRFLKERISRRQGIGIAVAIFGLLMIGMVTL